MAKRICSVDGCERGHLARGFCGTHYQRFTDHGTTETLFQRPKSKREPRPAGRQSLCDDQLSMFFPIPSNDDERRERKRQMRRQRRIEDLERVRARENARVSRAEVKQRNAENRKKYLRSDKGRYKTFVLKSQRRNIEMELTFEQWLEMTRSPCDYCGSHCLSDTSNGYGVDRVDPYEGYTLENSVACCGNCNIMKHLLSVDEFITHVRKIVVHQDAAAKAA